LPTEEEGLGGSLEEGSGGPKEIEEPQESRLSRDHRTTVCRADPARPHGATPRPEETGPLCRRQVRPAGQSSAKTCPEASCRGGRAAGWPNASPQQFFPHQKQIEAPRRPMDKTTTKVAGQLKARGQMVGSGNRLWIANFGFSHLIGRMMGLPFIGSAPIQGGTKKEGHQRIKVCRLGCPAPTRRPGILNSDWKKHLN